MGRRALIALVVIGTASALLFCGYQRTQEAPMFPWTSRAIPATESGMRPPIDLELPRNVETATFATG